MNSLSAYSCRPPESASTAQGDWAYQSAQIEKTTIAGEQSTDIEIQTADGDTVTLSSEIEFESTAITYEQLNRTGADYSQSQGQMISAHANSELELTVEGTLDAQEKAEIRAVLMNLFKMIKDFLAGKAPTENTRDFANLTTISAVNAEFDMNASVTVAAQASANYVTQTPVPDKPAIHEVETADRPAVADRPEQQAVHKVETANRPAVSERADKLTDRMISVVKDSGVDPTEILKRMNRRLARLSDRLMHARPAAWRRMRLRKQILEAFVSKLQKLAAENEAVGSNKGLTEAEKAVQSNDPAIVQTTVSASETILNVSHLDVHFELEYSAAAES